MKNGFRHPIKEAPGYWRNETGGQLRPAVERFLRGEAEQPGDIGRLRGYFIQWINSPLWEENPYWGEPMISELEELRQGARLIRTRGDIREWVETAVELGMDPL